MNVSSNIGVVAADTEDLEGHDRKGREVIVGATRDLKGTINASTDITVVAAATRDSKGMYVIVGATRDFSTGTINASTDTTVVAAATRDLKVTDV